MSSNPRRDVTEAACYFWLYRGNICLAW